MAEKTNKDYVMIALKLLIICSIVAFIVATVNFITEDKIAYNEKINTASALTQIFGDDFDGKAFTVDKEGYVIENDGEKSVFCTAAECQLNEDITALYVITDADGNVLFYCGAVSPMGFKAEINMLVALNPDLSVKGVKIVSMSETSGIGTKAQSEGFLSKFVGLYEDETKDVDTISGATKTSRPVIDAVTNVCNQARIYKSLSGGDR